MQKGSKQSAAERERQQVIRQQAEQILSSYDDQDRVRDRMTERRALAEKQMRADEIKSQICDKIRLEKESQPGLKERIQALAETDQELHNYIRKLEFINGGIWCPRCENPKNVPGHHEEKLSAKEKAGIEARRAAAEEALKPQPRDAEVEALKRQVAELQKRSKAVCQIVQETHREYHNKLQESLDFAHTLYKDLQTLHEQASELGLKIGSRPAANAPAFEPASESPRGQPQPKTTKNKQEYRDPSPPTPEDSDSDDSDSSDSEDESAKKVESVLDKLDSILDANINRISAKSILGDILADDE